MTKEKIISLCSENLNYMTDIRRQLHANPETGFDTVKTMELIASELKKMNITAKKCGKSGISALIGNGSPCILLRADCDALAINEETDLDFRSLNGNMHACGHDIHTSQLLGAAKILKMCEDSLKGSVKLMFQSAEETLEGASDMIDGGILENPSPDAALMIHVMTGTELESGTLIVPPHGQSAPSADFFRIKIKGKGCHGSSPSLGKDPLYSGCCIVCALSEINSRELAFGERAILTVGSFNAGENANVIPDSAEICGTLRCSGEETRMYVKKRICEIAECTAKAFGTEAETEFTSGCPSLVNDREMCALAYKALCDGLGEHNVIDGGKNLQGISKTSGSEDFSYITQKVPSVMLALAAGNTDDGHTHPLHHPKVTFDEKAMVNGCATLVFTALDYLKSN